MELSKKDMQLVKSTKDVPNLLSSLMPKAKIFGPIKNII